MPQVAAIGAAIGFTGTAAVIAGTAVVGAVAGGVISAINGDNILEGALIGGLIGGVAGWGLATFAPGVVGLEAGGAAGVMGPPTALADAGAVQAAGGTAAQVAAAGGTSAQIAAGVQPQVIPQSTLSLADKLALGTTATQAGSGYFQGKAQEEQLEEEKKRYAAEQALKKPEAPGVVETDPVITAQLTTQELYKKPITVEPITTAQQQQGGLLNA